MADNSTTAPPSSDEKAQRLARVTEKGFIDFPTAFEIVADADAAGAVHHDHCSWHAGMLCDCDVLKRSPEYLAAYGAPVTPQLSVNPNPPGTPS